jgi:GDPmannose 4,6-dehydratase
VAATGETHTVREFIEKAAPLAGFDIAWEGEGDNEKGRDRKSGKVIVEVDPKFYRPAEVDLLLGNPAKAKAKLGWKPKVGFGQLVEMMMLADLESLGVAA